MSTPTTDEIMGQAQVFASAWALVGSRFDSGDEMDRANGEKACLHGMVEALTKERDNAVYACGLVVQRCDRLVIERDTLMAAAKLALETLDRAADAGYSIESEEAQNALRQAGVQ